MAKKVALVVYNHSLWSESYEEQLDLYRMAGKELKLTVYCVAGKNLYPGLLSAQLQIESDMGMFDIKTVDFVVFLDKDIPLAQVLEGLGLKIYNSWESIGICDNKILTSIALAKSNISQPDIIFAPLEFVSNKMEEKSDYLKKVSKKLGFPLVVKEAYGSYGHQVYLAKDFLSLVEIVERIGTKPHLFQRFVASSEGRDVRVFVAGSQVVGAMLRENPNDFRANISNGGTVTAFTPTKNMEKLAISASLAVKSHFSGVDLLFRNNGEALLCEVNSSPHIKNYYDVLGENLAVHFLKEILSLN